MTQAKISMISHACLPLAAAKLVESSGNKTGGCHIAKEMRGFLQLCHQNSFTVLRVMVAALVCHWHALCAESSKGLPQDQQCSLQHLWVALQIQSTQEEVQSALTPFHKCEIGNWGCDISCSQGMWGHVCRLITWAHTGPEPVHEWLTSSLNTVIDCNVAMLVSQKVKQQCRK